MESEDSLSCSQKFFIDPCPELDNPIHILTTSFCKIHLHVSPIYA
jgi:hypothetical protein